MVAKLSSLDIANGHSHHKKLRLTPLRAYFKIAKKGVYELSCSFDGLTQKLKVKVIKDTIPEKEDPNQFGEMKLVKVLGKGGMGRVFLAKRRGDGEYFALKVIRRRYLNHQKLIEQFHKRGQNLSEVSSPEYCESVSMWAKGFHGLIW